MPGTIVSLIVTVLASQFSLKQFYRISDYKESYGESKFSNVSNLLAPKNLLQSHVNNVFAEKSENGSCTAQILLYAEGLARRDTWALKMIDSSTKIPSGILEGNIQDLGMYDECMGVHTMIGNTELRGRHCMYSFAIGNLSLYYPTFSICVPAACDNNSIAYILNNSLTHLPIIDKADIQLNSATCSKIEPEEWETGAIVTLSFFSIFFLLLTIATIIDIANRVSGNYYRSYRLQQLSRFSFYTNALRIISCTSKNNETIQILAGIRFLSMCWILLGHEYIIGMIGGYINFADVPDWLDSAKSLHITLAFYAVDTFFAISGFLVGYVVIKELVTGRSFNIVTFYLHRYIRLTPALLALILFVTYFLPRLGSGAHWDPIVGTMASNCKDKWWTILLYVQNYMNRDEFCVPHCWYLAVDMQLFWFSPIILYPLARKPKLGYIILVTCFLISIITPAAIIYANKYPVSMGANVDFNATMDSFNAVYLATYCRAGPYILGILFAYLSINRKLELKKRSHIAAGWLLTILSFVFVTMMTQHFKSKDYEYNAALEAFYASVSRPVWGFAILWLIVSSIHGYGGPIAAILSHPFYIPLARISYCFYLIHFNFQVALNSSTRTPRYFSNATTTLVGLHEIVVVSLLAFVGSLLMESPFLVLEKLVKEAWLKKKSESREQIVNEIDSENEEQKDT
ncbi:nose resistant to fluoxetine protein 6-like [Prorops nasuta]|uniref:nose resistant to fluoxetine protein 6-like n=1 Tax=Prorops nasuta TaxID=863751 RepID=UPI0034CE875C